MTNGNSFVWVLWFAFFFHWKWHFNWLVTRMIGHLGNGWLLLEVIGIIITITIIFLNEVIIIIIVFIFIITQFQITIFSPILFNFHVLLIHFWFIYDSLIARSIWWTRFLRSSYAGLIQILCILNDLNWIINRIAELVAFRGLLERIIDFLLILHIYYLL